MINKLKQLKSERVKLDKEIEQLEYQIKNLCINDDDMRFSIKSLSDNTYARTYKARLYLTDTHNTVDVSMALKEEHIKDIIGALSAYVGEDYEN